MSNDAAALSLHMIYFSKYLDITRAISSDANIQKSYKENI